MLKRIALLLLVVSASMTAAATIQVPGDYPTIQAAIDAAVAGDTVLVAPGEYVITEPITYRGKGITVRGEAGPEATIIRMAETPTDPNRASVVGFEGGETNAAVLEGVKITGGTARTGGGVFIDNASPVIRNCWITGNRTMDGYAIEDVSDTLDGGNGGGVFASPTATPLLIRCTSRPTRSRECVLSPLPSQSVA